MRVTHISNKSFNAIPTFPLRDVHLFPNTVIQLHVFEPRYVEMIDYAIEHNDCVISISSPLYREADLKDDDFPLHPILSAGFILHREKVAPDRYDVFVLGIARLTIREELEQIHQFRQIEAEVLQDIEVDTDTLWLKQIELKNIVLTYAERHPKVMERLYTMIAKLTDVDILSFTLGAHHLDTPEQRRELFEELDPLRRVELVTQKLCDTMADDSFRDVSEEVH